MSLQAQPVSAWKLSIICEYLWWTDWLTESQNDSLPICTRTTSGYAFAGKKVDEILDEKLGEHLCEIVVKSVP